VQLPFRTLSSVDAYIRNREWRDARLPCCPLHPSGGCLFARHGSYPRRTPRGLRIARWYCPEGRRTFSLLPDFLAARLPSLLVSIEESVTVASAVKSVEAAADALRGSTSPCPALSAGCVGASEGSELPLCMYRRRWLSARSATSQPQGSLSPKDPCCSAFAGRSRHRC
jgi:hypothetical protein